MNDPNQRMGILGSTIFHCHVVKLSQIEYPTGDHAIERDLVTKIIQKRTKSGNTEPQSVAPIQKLIELVELQNERSFYRDNHHVLKYFYRIKIKLAQ